jgi:hypothetical protein
MNRAARVVPSEGGLGAAGLLPLLLGRRGPGREFAESKFAL